MTESRRIDTPLAPEWSKDEKEEAFLKRLNDLLAPHDEADYRNIADPYPSVFILGAPRSGTTLVTQLLARHLDVGFVNNLIAAFWRAPLTGIRLSKKLLRSSRVISYRSSFGRTAHITEPHEFGYFWSVLLGYEEQSQRDSSFEEAIPWDRVRLVLSNMAEEFHLPVVYKSFYIIFHMQRLLSVLPNSLFVHVRRDPLQNALSLLDLRRSYSGGENEWAGIKPIEYEWLSIESVPVQIAGQIFFLEQRIAEQSRSMPRRNILHVDYEDVCLAPSEILDTIRGTLERLGASVDMTEDAPRPFDPSIRNVADDHLGTELEEALQRFFGPQDRYDRESDK